MSGIVFNSTKVLQDWTTMQVKSSCGISEGKKRFSMVQVIIWMHAFPQSIIKNSYIVLCSKVYALACCYTSIYLVMLSTFQTTVNKCTYEPTCQHVP